MSKAFSVFLLLVFSLPVFSQVVISPVGSLAREISKKSESTVYNTLPFLDDFSNYEGLPEESKWEGAGVVVNHSFQYNPPTVGVATLDATDIYGKLYSMASTSGFSADTLTSMPIRLDSIFLPNRLALSPSDSVYLSFCFQPAGGGGEQWELIGSQPSQSDSLILEFYSPEQGWSWVWAVGGESVDSLYQRYGTYYQYVLIPITQEEYFTKEFRFRFRNVASLNNSPLASYVGNCDQWNIDYVYLNRNRSSQDTTRGDLAFVDPAPSMLKRYQAMPARQFLAEEMNDSLQIKIINLSDRTLNSTYKYEITTEEGVLLYNYDGGFENIAPYQENSQYQTSFNHSRPPITFSFDINPQRWYSFDITHIIKEGVGQDDLPANDTIRFKQIFEDYFAYDDGTAENGIGVEPISGSHLAVGFKLNAPDTLSSVDIYFNTSLNGSNFKDFFICVWSSENGLPKDIIYKTEQLMPQSDSLNRFVRYVLEERVALSEGLFFISLQTKGNDYLNIGFDRNTNSSQYTYSKTTSVWLQSFEKGSVMLRPYFGYKAVGLEEVKDHNIMVYPNPTCSELNLRNCNGTTKNLFDLTGRLVLQSKYERIDISHLENGIYILRVSDKGRMIYTTKIIKTN